MSRSTAIELKKKNKPTLHLLIQMKCKDDQDNVKKHSYYILNYVWNSGFGSKLWGTGLFRNLDKQNTEKGFWLKLCLFL